MLWCALTLALAIVLAPLLVLIIPLLLLLGFFGGLALAIASALMAAGSPPGEAWLLTAGIAAFAGAVWLLDALLDARDNRQFRAKYGHRP